MRILGFSSTTPDLRPDVEEFRYPRADTPNATSTLRMLRFTLSSQQEVVDVESFDLTTSLTTMARQNVELLGLLTEATLAGDMERKDGMQRWLSFSKRVNKAAKAATALDENGATPMEDQPEDADEEVTGADMTRAAYEPEKAHNFINSEKFVLKFCFRVLFYSE